MARIVPVDPFDLVIFGGTGDLATRKLLPALYHRDRDRQFSDDTRIIGLARSEMDAAAYRERVREALQRRLGDGEFDDEVWERFAARLSYLQLDAAGDAGWPALADRLGDDRQRICVFYLATAPRLFGPIAKRIAGEGLARECARIVLEKPVGHDLESAERINDEVGAVFGEHQVFRIDHYLGKETVQNLIALRFGNSLFEPLWRRGVIDHVQITVAEELGVGQRGDYYDSMGALRDMVQNHLLQLVCLVAMEPPTSLEQDEVRDEKLKVLRALRPIPADCARSHTVRGQYVAGAIDGEAVPAYVDELEAGASDTETFVALKVHIDNWRWAETPFYLRTGKRLSRKLSEIAVQFAPVAHSIFTELDSELRPNRLTIRLQPDEGVHLSMMVKEPGPGGFELRSVRLNLSFDEAFDLRYPDAYERLLMEVVRGRPALFMRRDEVSAAWKWIDGICEGWSACRQKALPYQAGTWGPAAADMLLDRDGRSWRTNGA